MFPDIASAMSLSVGLEFSASKTAALMICPDWQYPHCGTSISIQACCRGCVRSGESPSMVVIFLPSARETGATQERTASPSICTVQAPQRAIPQPNLVPVSCSESRSTQSSGVDGGSSTETGLPFTVNEIKGSSSKLDASFSYQKGLGATPPGVQRRRQPEDYGAGLEESQIGDNRIEMAIGFNVFCLR